MLDLIIKKRDGLSLSEEEIFYIVRGFCSGDIENYQMSAMLMAIYFNGLSLDEAYFLTKAIIESGDKIDFLDLDVFDKHSTGGVGDKVSLILIPLLHSFGFTIAKMSGRGLGHTGGTVDKLESIKGFKVDLGFKEFLNQVNKHHIALVSQSSDICIADKLLYALRDVTGTVESIGLIACSIMSKKIASGSKHILIDIKVGSGAFMKTIEEAIELARYMKYIASKFCVSITCLLTDMNEPLGNAIGNISEVLEAYHFLLGKDCNNLNPLIINMAKCVLKDKYKDSDLDNLILDKIKSGSALESFKLLIDLQGGDFNYIKDFNLLDHTKLYEVKSNSSGYLSSFDTLNIGNSIKYLGGGREHLSDKLDYNVSIYLNKHLNDYVNKGDTIFYVYHNERNLSKVIDLLNNSYTLSNTCLDIKPLFKVLS